MIDLTSHLDKDQRSSATPQMSPIRASSVKQAQPGFSAGHHTAHMKAMRAIDVVQSEP
jgi:hypothetical protein